MPTTATSCAGWTRRNGATSARYGFGIKAFVLSMIETAIEVTDDRVPASVIRQLIAAGHEMLAHPIELLPHAARGGGGAGRRAAS